MATYLVQAIFDAPLRWNRQFSGGMHQANRAAGGRRERNAAAVCYCDGVDLLAAIAP